MVKPQQVIAMAE
jgi:hypothetical protein